jgi:hypothetical protein
VDWRQQLPRKRLLFEQHLGFRSRDAHVLAASPLGFGSWGGSRFSQARESVHGRSPLTNKRLSAQHEPAQA